MQKALESFTQLIQTAVPISTAEAANFFDNFQLHELRTDEYMVREGQVCDFIGFLETGMIRYYYVNDGEEVTRWVSLENDFVTALGSFITQTPCSHFLQAVQPVRIWKLEKKRWIELYRQQEPLRELWARMIERNVVGFENRVYQQLASDAEQRYLYFLKNYPAFIEKVPQKYIASMIGIQPESLSRLRAKLAQKGNS